MYFEGEGYSKQDAQSILDALADTAFAHLKKGEEVRLRGLAVLKVAVRPARKARMGRNPATGEAIKIAAKPASKKIALRPQAALKARLGFK